MVGLVQISKKETVDLTMCRWNFSHLVPSGDILILIIVIRSQVASRYRGWRSPLSFLEVPGRMILENLTRRSSDVSGTVFGFPHQECQGKQWDMGYKGLESD